MHPVVTAGKSNWGSLASARASLIAVVEPGPLDQKGPDKKNVPQLSGDQKVSCSNLLFAVTLW